MNLGITGPRPGKIQNDYSYTGPMFGWIRERLTEKFVQHKPDLLITGLALGVDTVAALLAIDMNIPIMAAIPFLGQEDKWQKAAKDLYHHILCHKATIVKIVSLPGYADWKMQKRNQFIVDESDLVLGVTDHTPGGTSNCLAFAAAVKRQIDIIDLRCFK